MSERESPKQQEMGPKKYREMIHKNAKAAMNNPKLPFKPVPKSKIIGGGTKAIECDKCGATLFGTKFTYMIICSNCNKIVRVDSDYASS